MRALVLNNINQPLDFQEVSSPEPRKGEVVVALRSAALNHRDLWITKGQYAGIKFPSVLGSDGAGELDGQAVVINPSLNWGKNPRTQGRDFRILGLPDDGTFAQQVCVPKRNVLPKPAHLTWEQAAALPLAGLTAWRVLASRCQVRKGERVLVSGVGGGVALFALQFAVAAGAEVWVTSGSDAKIERAVQMGAKGGSNYRQPDWDKRLRADSGGFDAVIDSALGDSFNQLVGLCNPGARIGIYGATQGAVGQFNPRPVFWKQISVLGSTMGSDREFAQMLAFVERRAVVPVVDSVFDLAEGNQALARMEKGDQFGKIVLRCG